MKKLLAISTAVAMLGFSGAAYAQNLALQGQAFTYKSHQTAVQIGSGNVALQGQLFTAKSSQKSIQIGDGNFSAQGQFATDKSSQTIVQISP